MVAVAVGQPAKQAERKRAANSPTNGRRAHGRHAQILVPSDELYLCKTVQLRVSVLKGTISVKVINIYLQV